LSLFSWIIDAGKFSCVLSFDEVKMKTWSRVIALSSLFFTILLVSCQLFAPAPTPAPTATPQPSIKINSMEVAPESESRVFDRDDETRKNNCEAKTATAFSIQRATTFESTVAIERGEKLGLMFKGNTVTGTGVEPIALNDAENSLTQGILSAYRIENIQRDISVRAPDLESPPHSVTTAKLKWYTIWKKGHVRVQGLLNGKPFEESFPFSLKYNSELDVAGKADEDCVRVSKEGFDDRLPETTRQVEFKNCEGTKTLQGTLTDPVDIEYIVTFEHGDQTGAQLKMTNAVLPSARTVPLGYDAEALATNEVINAYGIDVRSKRVEFQRAIDLSAGMVTTARIKRFVIWKKGKVYVIGADAENTFKDWFVYRFKYDVDREVSLDFESCKDVVARTVRAGDDAVKAKNFNVAVDAYSKALEYTPRDDSILVKRGDAYRELKDWTRAQQDCDQAAQINTLNVQAWACKARIQLERRSSSVDSSQSPDKKFLTTDI
jgi:hypothetical protein